MRAVDQTKFVGDIPSHRPEDAGNCMQAAVASIFELPLDDVPHFAADPSDAWWSKFVAWCRARGFAVVTSTDPVDGVVGMCTGRSPRGAFKHVVVTRGAEVAHDPHPSRAGIESFDEWTYFLALDPVAAAPAEGAET